MIRTRYIQRLEMLEVTSIVVALATSSLKWTERIL